MKTKITFLTPTKIKTPEKLKRRR